MMDLFYKNSYKKLFDTNNIMWYKFLCKWNGEKDFEIGNNVIF